eukprot:3935545-Rhodomonas_salina.1
MLCSRAGSLVCRFQLTGDVVPPSCESLRIIIRLPPRIDPGRVRCKTGDAKGDARAGPIRGVPLASSHILFCVSAPGVQSLASTKRAAALASGTRFPTVRYSSQAEKNASAASLAVAAVDPDVPLCGKPERAHAKSVRPRKT